MSKAVIQPFEEYQKSRIMFVQTVAELATREKHIDSLKSVGVMKLLGPLLSDPVTSIKQSAALAIGRLARHNRELANSVIEDNGKIIKLLLDAKDTNKFYKKATCFVIASVARHNEALAEAISTKPAIDFLVNCLEEYDPSVKSAAVWALGYIAKHNEKLASKVVNDNKAISYLILCLQEPEIHIKRITIQTITYIAKHNQELTTRVTDNADHLNYILYFLVLKDTTLKVKICNCLADMAKNSSLVASRIIQELNTRQLEECIQSPHPNVQKSAITLINAIASRDNLSQTVNEKIKPEQFIDFLVKNKGNSRTYGIPLISTMARDKEEIAKKYVDGKVLVPLNECIIKIINRLDRKKDLIRDQNKKDPYDNENHTENDINATLACKAIADLAKHKLEITNEIADYENLPYNLLTLAITPELPKELMVTAKDALEQIIEHVDQLKPINSILNFSFNPHDTRLPFDKNPYHDILVKLVKKQKDILSQGNKNDKKYYLHSGALAKVLKLKKQYNRLEPEIPDFNGLFSGDIVNFYDEDYAENLKKDYIQKN